MTGDEEICALIADNTGVFIHIWWEADKHTFVGVNLFEQLFIVTHVARPTLKIQIYVVQKRFITNPTVAKYFSSRHDQFGENIREL